MAATAAAGAGFGWHAHHIPFVSQCEHHMLPFYGAVHIAYILRCTDCGAAVGEKLTHEEVEQVVAAFTQRLQVQERITQQIVEAVADLTGAAGVLVVVRAAHMCMVARGVENHAGTTLSRAAVGEFEGRPELRAQFLRAVAAFDNTTSPLKARSACACGC